MSAPTRIRIGSWIASPALNQLDNGERSVRLESRTMDVLVYLAARPGEVVSMEELLGAVWQSVVVSDSSVYQAIKQLRQALAGSGDDTRYIETIPKRGYRLVAPVERLVPDTPRVAPQSPAPPPAPLAAPAPEGPSAVSPRAVTRWIGRAWPIAATLAAGLLLGAGLTSSWFRGGAAPPVAGAAPTLRFSIPVDGLGGLALSRDGRFLVYSAGKTAADAQLYVRPLDALDAQPIAGAVGAVMPFWSADGDEIGFLSLAEQLIGRIGLAGGMAHDVVGTPPFGTLGSWNADDVILFDSGTGIARVPAAGGEAVKVTKLDESRGEVAHVAPSFLPDGRRFFFAMAFSTPGVYVGSLDSAEGTRVLPFSATAAYAGGHILYNRGDALFAQPFDDRELKLHGAPIQLADGLVTDASGIYAAFSVSDTGVLAYTAGDPVMAGPAPSPSQLAWYDRNGRRLEQVGESGLYRGIALSPDGKRVVVHRHEHLDGGNLWLRDLERGTFARITFGAGHDLWPIWSPDGASVLFSGTGFNVYKARADGAGGEELVLDSLRIPRLSDWIAGTVLISHVRDKSSDVSALRLDGTGAISPTLSTRFNEGEAIVSPNGRRLAYISDESGDYEVYVSSYPELDDKLQVSTAGGVSPLWSRDGRELFYVTRDGTFMSAPLDADGGILPPRTLFKTNVAFFDHPSGIGMVPDRAYDVSSDGQRFLINERSAGGPEDIVRSADVPLPRATIVVVANWANAIDE